MADMKPISDHDLEKTPARDPHPTWRPTSEHPEVNAAHHMVNELPPLGYPIGEEAVQHWFERTFNRMPEVAEVGVILDAMTRRDEARPVTESASERAFKER